MTNKEWSVDITNHRRWFEFSLREVLASWELVRVFVHRDLVATYKQTILGPIWIVLQPLLMTLLFVVVFGNIVELPSDGVPHALFYLSGIICWTFYADCLSKVATTVVDNEHLFSKVYFPRLICPISIVFSHLIRVAIQLVFLFFVFIYYWHMGRVELPGLQVSLSILVLFIVAAHGLGFGLLFSAFTYKYRDLRQILGFVVRLGFYSTPVIYPLSLVPADFRWWVLLNPLTHLVEAFKFCILGTGEITFYGMLYAVVSALLLLFLGMTAFYRVESKFMDSI